MIKKIEKQNAGFTLIEVMVSVGIFAIVVLVSMTAVLSIVDANKKAQSLNDVINNMNFTVESMVRDLRTGYDYDCVTSCVSSVPIQLIKFHSSVSGGLVTYFLDSSTHTIKKTFGSVTESLTSANINVSRFDLYVTRPAAGTGQPLILMIIQATGQVGKQKSDFNLQTLIAQRRLNI